MPYNVYAPNFALLASFDARDWSGVDVISYASQTVTLPEYGSTQPPPLALLGLWSSPRTTASRSSVM